MHAITSLALTALLLLVSCARHPTYGKPKPRAPITDSITQVADTTTHRPTP
jgi:hypothetical protein